MKETTKAILNQYKEKYRFINDIETDIVTAVDFLCTSYANKGKLLVCGNGGSNSDADHIVGELLKGFLKMRPLDTEMKQALENYGEGMENLACKLQGSLPAINLGAQTSVMTATINDIDGAAIYAQQVIGLGNVGDVFVGISTSGNSKNVLYAAMIAKEKGLKTIGLTGTKGGKMKDLMDCIICVPSLSTPDIQDMHTSVYHVLCAMVENEFFDE